MTVTHVFAAVAVADLGPALEFYERLTGRPPDLVPHAGEAAWQLTDTGWIVVLEDAEAAGHAGHTLLVDDLDAELDALAGRGIAAGPVETLGSGARKAEVRDPEGNRIAFGSP